MTAVNKIRNSNFELLRIIAMFAIIGLHYFNGTYGGAMANVKPGEQNWYIVNLIESFLLSGTNIFILISGFFLITKKSINIKKVINLLLICIFYNFFFLVMSVAIGEQTLNFKLIYENCFPFFVKRRWFLEYYMILYLLSPFINKLLCNISGKNYEILLIIQLILFSIWPSFLPNPPINDGGYGIINFITLYMIAGYVRLHVNFKLKNSLLILIYTLSSLLIFAFGFTYWKSRSTSYYYIFNLIASVAVFLLFKNFSLKSSKCINFVASCTFGIYIIYTDYNIKDFFYQNVLHCSWFYHSYWLIPHFIFSVFLIFSIGVFLEFLRQKVWKKTIGKIIDNIKFIDFNIEV